MTPTQGGSTLEEFLHDALNIILIAMLVALLSLIVIIDFREQRIPNWANAALFFIGLVLSSLPNAQGLPWAIFSSLVTLCMTMAFATGYEALRGRAGMGYGDIKFLSASATITGLQNIPALILGAATTALMYALLLRLRGTEITGSTRLPFGPFLVIGLLMVWMLEFSSIDLLGDLPHA